MSFHYHILFTGLCTPVKRETIVLPAQQHYLWLIQKERRHEQ